MKKEPPNIPSLDGAKPVGPMVLTGVVKTTKGYAVARAVVSKDGAVTLSMGHSQAFKEYVAAEHKKALIAASLKA